MKCLVSSLVLLLALCCFGIAQDNQRKSCPIGEFYSPASNSCVTECPCGMYGDAVSTICRQGGQLFFGKSRLNIVGSVNDGPIHVVNLIIEDILFESASSAFHFGRFISSNYISDNYNSHSLASLFYSLLKIEFNNKQIPQTHGSNNVDLTTNNATTCTAGNRTYLYFPIRLSPVNVTGSVKIYLFADFFDQVTSLSYVSSVDVSLNVDNGCNGDLLYEISSGECVETCSCAFSIGGSCQPFDSLGRDVAFGSDLKIISVTSQSTPGSLIGTVNVYINANYSSGLLRVNEYTQAIHHNDSSARFRYYHNIEPTFRLKAKNIISSQMDDHSITFNAYSLSKLRDTPSAQCTDGTTQYLILKVDLVLTSDSLYHLGDHTVNMYINYGFNNYIDAALLLRVQAECDDPSLLYDFATHECVSQCSCGHTPFRSHSTAYCEAAAYYNVAEFLNDQTTIQIPFNSSIPTISTNISMYVNFAEIDNLIQWYGNGDATVFARLSVVSIYSGIDLPVNNTIVPVATLTAPNGTESMIVDILLNINETHIERCHDSFVNQTHTLVNVPVNIRSPLMYTQLGEYDFTITLDLISPDSSNLNTLLQYDTDDTFNLTVNITETSTRTMKKIVQENTFNFTITAPNTTFKQARQQLFRVTTAMVINDYCSINLCTIVPSNGDPPVRISGLSVSEQDVAIPNSLLSRNAQGQLVVGFYIQTQQGFIALATIQQSVKAGEKHFQDAQFRLMATPLPSIASSSSVHEISTSTVTSTPPPVAREVSSLVVPLVGAVGGAIVLGILVTIIIIAVVWIKIYMQNRALAGFRRHEDDCDEVLKADSKNIHDQEKGVIEMEEKCC